MINVIAPVDAIDLVEESVAIFDLDMHVKSWNAEAERLYGWRRDEVIGGRIQAAVRCSPTETLPIILAKVRATGTWRGEFVRTTKSGATVVVRAKWSLRQDGNGAPLDIVETSRDITQIRRTEEALDRVQSQYQSLFRAPAASFWELDFSAVANLVRTVLAAGVTDLSDYFHQHPAYVRELIRATRVIDVNEQTVATFGDGSRDGLLRGLDPLWPDESLHVFAESVAAAFRKQDHYSAEVVLHSLNGRRLDTLLTVSYPPELRHSARLLAGVIDVTDSKRARAAQERSERRYKDVFHFLPIALLQLDVTEALELLKELRAAGIRDLSAHLKQHPDLLPKLLEGLKVVEVNRRTLEMFGARSPEEFVGHSVARYWTEHPEPVRDALAARYSGKSGFEALVKIRAHDGTMLDALFFAAFGPVTGEQHVSLCGFIDVTDRVRAQEMLSKLQAEMAHAARVSVLGELTASIAHEVGQPLTAIEANTQATLLWAEQIPPNIKEIRDLSASTAAQVQRAAAIIHRIRSMAVRIDPEYTVIDVNPMIEDSVLFLRSELQRNRIETSLGLIDGLPRISGDRVQLQQVIVNLAVNAIQSMATISTPSRVLGITSRETADGGVLIEVEDNGTGFTAETLGRLFESFFTTKSSGMGIGLPICRSIIDAHGGRIFAANRTDGTEGARFSITLPGLHPKDLSRPWYRGPQPLV